MYRIVSVSSAIAIVLAGLAIGCSSQATKEPAASVQPAVAPAAVLVAQKTCPVMGGGIDKSVFVDHEGTRVYFCCAACPPEFNLGETPQKL
jgi:hypothetical protein